MTSTVAPRAAAICTQKTAAPPPAPGTSTTVPGPTCPWVTTARQAVSPATGSAAVSAQLQPAGRGRT